MFAGPDVGIEEFLGQGSRAMRRADHLCRRRIASICPATASWCSLRPSGSGVGSSSALVAVLALRPRETVQDELVDIVGLVLVGTNATLVGCRWVPAVPPRVFGT